MSGKDYGQAFGISGAEGIVTPRAEEVFPSLKKKHRMNVPEMLTKLADINRERGGAYGRNYAHGGAVLKALFQDGEITLRTEEEYNRFSLLVYMAGKLSRYAWNLSKGGHDDSLDDLAVYAMLAKDCDWEERERGLTAVERGGD